MHGVGAMVSKPSVGGEGTGGPSMGLGGALGTHSIGGMGIRVPGGQSFPALVPHGISSSSSLLIQASS